MVDQLEIVKVKVKELQERPEYTFVNTLLLTMLQLHTIDKLKDTPYYRADIKIAATQYLVALSKMYKKDVLMLRNPTDGEDNDANASNKINLMQYLSNFLLETATLSTEYFGVCTEIMRAFKKDPEQVMSLLNIELTD